jgi:hypothetical protein
MSYVRTWWVGDEVTWCGLRTRGAQPVRRRHVWGTGGMTEAVFCVVHQRATVCVSGGVAVASRDATDAV